MLLIGKKVSEFKAKAYHKGEFIEITNESMKGKWAAVVFYPVSTDTEFVHKA